MNNTNYTVYALVDPITDVTKYVGQTGNMQRRFVQHLQYRGCNLALNAWIANLALQGYVPICKTLEVVQNAHTAHLQEAYHIGEYKESIFNLGV